MVIVDTMRRRVNERAAGWINRLRQAYRVPVGEGELRFRNGVSVIVGKVALGTDLMINLEGGNLGGSVAEPSVLIVAVQPGAGACRRPKRERHKVQDSCCHRIAVGQGGGNDVAGEGVPVQRR